MTMIDLDNVNLEALAEKVHNAWWIKKKEHGFHSPTQCDNYDANIHLASDEVCSRCHKDMIPYKLLKDDVKEYDRVTAMTVLNALRELATEPIRK